MVSFGTTKYWGVLLVLGNVASVSLLLEIPLLERPRQGSMVNHCRRPFLSKSPKLTAQSVSVTKAVMNDYYLLPLQATLK